MILPESTYLLYNHTPCSGMVPDREECGWSNAAADWLGLSTSSRGWQRGGAQTGLARVPSAHRFGPSAKENLVPVLHGPQVMVCNWVLFSTYRP